MLGALVIGHHYVLYVLDGNFSLQVVCLCLSGIASQIIGPNIIMMALILAKSDAPNDHR